MFICQPYPQNIINIRAILLGCDPSNRHCQNLPYVFGINPSHKIFNGLVESLRKNLRAVNLDLENVYSQNLCRNYFRDETSKNKKWKTVAEMWIPVLKEELDEKFSKDIPVLLTSEVLYKVLLNGNIVRRKAKTFYFVNKKEIIIPIPSEDNKLYHPLIPFYRHYAYQLQKRTEYKEKILEVMKL
jgi:hypothetical protein